MTIQSTPTRRSQPPPRVFTYSNRDPRTPLGRPGRVQCESRVRPLRRRLIDGDSSKVSGSFGLDRCREGNKGCEWSERGPRVLPFHFGDLLSGRRKGGDHDPPRTPRLGERRSESRPGKLPSPSDRPHRGRFYDRRHPLHTDPDVQGTLIRLWGG